MCSARIVCQTWETRVDRSAEHCQDCDSQDYDSWLSDSALRRIIYVYHQKSGIFRVTDFTRFPTTAVMVETFIEMWLMIAHSYVETQRPEPMIDDDPVKIVSGILIHVSDLTKYFDWVKIILISSIKWISLRFGQFSLSSRNLDVDFGFRLLNQNQTQENIRNRSTQHC